MKFPSSIVSALLVSLLAASAADAPKAKPAPAKSPAKPSPGKQAAPKKEGESGKPKAPGQVFRVGLIGLDTSHVTAFTSRFNDPKGKNHVPGAKVVAAFKGGSPDIPSSAERIDKFTETLVKQYGVKLYDTVEEMCEHVDVVMLESVDGRPHLEQAIPVIKARKPMFIDKPIAGSLRDAIEIYKLAKKYRTPIWSSSSLRFYPGVQEVANAPYGDLTAAVSYGPCSLEPSHPDLFWYGIHGTEALFTVMGTGCETVVRTSTENTDVVTGTWKDGKAGTFIGLRGARGYSVTAFGTKKVVAQSKGGDYTPMLVECVKFFQTGKPPVSMEETIEIYAFMEAADESKRRGGCPVKVTDVLRANGW